MILLPTQILKIQRALRILLLLLKRKKRNSFFSFVLWGGILCFAVYFVLSVRALVEKYKQESLVKWSPKSLKRIERIETEESAEILKNKGTDKMAMNKREEKNLPKEKSEERALQPLKEEIVKTQIKDVVNMSHQLILKSSQNVEILLIKNGEKKRIALLKGETQIIKFSSPIEIIFDEGGVTNIYYNGKDKGFLGKKGKSFRVKYP